MKIKTFPLQFVDVQLDKIRNASAYLGMTMKEFMLDAISAKVEEVENKMKGE